MKITEVRHSEPTVQLEVRLSELKWLRDIIGAFSPKEVKERFREQGIDIHPNLGEQMFDQHESLSQMVISVVNQTSSSVKQGIGK